jgi:hypothetical protein
MKASVVRMAMIATALGMAVAGCSKWAGPKSHDEAMKAAKEAYAAGDLKKVYQLCGKAVELADKVGNGSQAIFALDCYTDMASRIGKTSDTLPAYATVIGTYPEQFRVTGSRYRLRNNYAMALEAAGKREQAVATLVEALDARAGTAYAGWDTQWERMHIVRNLAKLRAKQPASATSLAFATEWADEIEAHVARNRTAQYFALGSGAALEALADLLSANDNPARAASVRAGAREQVEAEASYIAANPTSANRCHKLTTIVGTFDRCFVDLP